MSRIVAENLNNISVYSLKSFGLFDYENSLVRTGVINWRINGNITSRVGYSIRYEGKIPTKIIFEYISTRTSEEFNPSVNLSRTVCNYGKYRYWFDCPNCSLRCAKLYLYQNTPYCRKCLNLTYEVNNRSKEYRNLDVLFGTIKSEDYKKRLEKTNRYYYANKPTKTYRSYLKYRKTTDDLNRFERYYSGHDIF